MAEEPDSFGAGDTTPQTTPPVVPAPSHGKTAATLPDMPDIPMAQDPDMHMAQDLDDDDNMTVHLPMSISTLPNMGTPTTFAGLFLKNPTKTTAI